MHKKLILFFLLLLLVLVNTANAQVLPYKNPKLSIDVRVADLLQRMTLEEKFWQLFMIPGDLDEGKEKYKHGIFGFQTFAKGQTADAIGQMLSYQSSGSALQTAEKINAIQKYFLEETRLGIPIIPFDEALHGLVRDGAIVFPQSIALASTWNTSLMFEVSSAIANECKIRGIRQVLSPVINIASDVRWGRTEETFGEDPFLVSQMGVTYVSAFEQQGVITTPKHFVANVGAGGRDSYPIQFSERYLFENDFQPFMACFSKGKSRSVMTSYNSLDGSPCTANDRLLNQILKKDWGFTGFVISDACAVGGANVLHNTALDYADATAQAINSGLDVIFQTSYDHYPLFWSAFEKGMIDPKAIDEAVSRVLRAKFELGLFENPYVNISETENFQDRDSIHKLARQAARESIVLLKNDNDLLPLKSNLKSIAIIGPDATDCRLGGYSGPGVKKTSVLDGIKAQLPLDCKVNYAYGVDREYVAFVTIPAENLSCTFKSKTKNGLYAEYFNNMDLSGNPIVIKVDENMKFSWTLFPPDPKLESDNYSIRWTGLLTSPATGKFKIGIEGNDGYRLFINNIQVIDCWKKVSFGTKTIDYDFQKDKVYNIRLEYFESSGSAKLNLIWNYGVTNNWQQQIGEAVEMAKKSEVVILTAGIEEGEFRDRAMLNLPGKQEQLIDALASVNKPIIVLLSGGSAVTMNNWINKVDAVADIWYPGEEGGNAVADVLFGKYNPSGKLPITFPMNEAQLPLVYNHKPTGRGDDYNNLTGQPLFPFGYGLSYTTFEYSDLKFTTKQIAVNNSTKVSCKIKNTGKYAGEEVAQLYIRDILASVSQPVIALKGFRKIFLQPGEIKEVSFEITPEILQILNKNMEWTVETGDFRIMIGASSKDIRLRDNLTLIAR
jgi:beta-glucosidase